MRNAYKRGLPGAEPAVEHDSGGNRDNRQGRRLLPVHSFQDNSFLTGCNWYFLDGGKSDSPGRNLTKICPVSGFE
jgi:hypothetical protein